MSPDLENLVLGEEPDTRLGQGTLSFNATPGIHSEASAHISKLPLNYFTNLSVSVLIYCVFIVCICSDDYELLM